MASGLVALLALVHGGWCWQREWPLRNGRRDVPFARSALELPAPAWSPRCWPDQKPVRPVGVTHHSPAARFLAPGRRRPGRPPGRRSTECPCWKTRSMCHRGRHPPRQPRRRRLDPTGGLARRAADPRQPGRLSARSGVRAERAPGRRCWALEGTGATGPGWRASWPTWRAGGRDRPAQAAGAAPGQERRPGRIRAGRERSAATSWPPRAGGAARGAAGADGRPAPAPQVRARARAATSRRCW